VATDFIQKIKLPVSIIASAVQSFDLVLVLRKAKDFVGLKVGLLAQYN